MGYLDIVLDLDLRRAALLCVPLLVLYMLYRRWTRVSISHIPGPEPDSWLLGNMAQYLQSEAGVMDLKWQDEFGGVVRIKGVMGEDKLFVSDPKALQYILNSGYSFRKGQARKELSRVFIGRGLTYADGDVHKRQRRINSPAFGYPETKSYLPLYSHYANRLIEKWKAEIGATGTQAATIDIPVWVSRAALDIIGEAAFDYKFQAMDGGSDELKESFSTVAIKSFSAATDGAVVLQGLLDNAPIWLSALFCRHAPFLAFARRTYALSVSVARGLVEEKKDALLKGGGKRDIMSLLVKANASEDERSNLSEDEMLSQMMTLMAAGFETTSNSLTWTCYELSRSPHIQSRLRAEIREVFERGPRVLSVNDFESMPYFSAFTKEFFRFYPVVPYLQRAAMRDVVVPLSKPVVGLDGKVLEAVVVPVGTNVIVSIAGFNRNKEVFGQDANVFNPERWLEGRVDNCGAPLGAYSNLATFGGGVRSCIGWRFALLEYQMFLAEIVNQLEFGFADVGPERIRKESAVLMCPKVEGEKHEGCRLPLRVSIAPREVDE